MTERKFLSIVSLLCSFFTVTNSLVFAAPHCTRQVVNSDGIITIDTDCSDEFSSMQPPQNFLDTYYYGALEDTLQDRLDLGIQNFKDRTGDRLSTEDRTDRIAADSQQKEQEVIDAQRIKQQDQKTKLENSK